MTNFEKKTGIKPCCIMAMFLLIASLCCNVFLYNRCVKLTDVVTDIDCAMQREMNIIDTLFNANKDLYFQLKKDDAIILELKQKNIMENIVKKTSKKTHELIED